MSKQPITFLPNLYANGMNVAWASTTTFTISAGQVRNSTDNFDITLSAPMTLALSTDIDTGTAAASKVYAVHIISDSSGFHPVDALFSLSATAPTLPAGYDIFRRIGWIVTDVSTHVYKLYQSGTGATRMYTYDETPAALTSGTANTFTAIDLSAFVPAVNNIPVLLDMEFTPNTAGDSANIRAAGSSATNGWEYTGVAAGKVQESQLAVIATLASGLPKIEYKVATSGSLNININTFTDFI